MSVWANLVKKFIANAQMQWLNKVRFLSCLLLYLDVVKNVFTIEIGNSARAASTDLQGPKEFFRFHGIFVVDWDL